MNLKFLNKKTLRLGRLLTSPRFLNAVSVFIVFFFIITVVSATTPDPGHPWTEVGDGTFQVTGPSALRTYTFPNNNATVVTSSSFSQGDLIYGSSASTTAQLAKDTNSTRYISNTGSSNNPAWAQVDMTNGVTGTLPSSNGGTGNAYTKFSGPTTSEKTFTLPDSSATILTNNTAVTVAQGGTGLAALTVNNVIIGNGASAPSFAAPTAAGNIIASNGSTWLSATSSDPIFFQTIGLSPIVATAVTAVASGDSYYQYMGVASKTYTACTLIANVTTAVSGTTWAEVGLFKGTPPLNTTASLTRITSNNVAATYNSVGIKTTSMTATSIKKGDNMWVAFGSSATTPFQLRGTLADNLQSGVFQAGTGVRPSTASSPFTTSLQATTTVPAWVRMKCV